MTDILRSASYTEGYLNHQDSHLSSHLPIIFDDETSAYRGGADLVENHSEENGLLGKANLAGAFLPMSSYDGKPYYPSAKDTGRLQNAMFLGTYAQPDLSQPHLPSAPTSYTRQTDQVPYSNSAAPQPRSYLQTGDSEFMTSQAAPIAQVTSFQPQHGPESTKVYIRIFSEYDLKTSSTLNFYAMFASRRCPTTISSLESQGSYKDHYMLAVDVPAFQTTGWHSHNVPLQLQVQDESGLDVCLPLECGTFTYTNTVQQQAQLPQQDLSRKRKISLDSVETARSPAKRTSSQQLRPPNPEIYGMHQYIQQADSSYLQQSSLKAEQSSLEMETASFGSLMPSYSRSQSQSGYLQHESPRRVSHQLSTSSGSSYSQIRGHSPQTPSYSPSLVTVSHPGKSPHLTAPVVSRQSTMSSPSTTTNPPLYRTSTLQQQSPNPPEPQAISAPFNPYNIYPHHKAILRIEGDLETMTSDWNEDEWEGKRRLVQFWRSQTGNTIHTNFKPVAPEDRPPNSICISCIFWESKKDWFVTSVDTIYLLESLVAVRFTVEEKNRIRRNLEGFRPITVSKGKSDSEDFFKLIMGFPNPKPRNIEKDVKVFPWKILSHALNKIIGKYSASYSSTASTISTAANSTYHSIAASNSLGDDDLSAASHSASASASSYTVGITTTHHSADGAHKRAVSYPPGRTGLLQIPENEYPYSIPSTMDNPAGALAMMQPVHRASWDFSGMPYTQSAATGVNPALPEMYYPLRTGSKQGAPSAAYQMTHTSSGI